MKMWTTKELQYLKKNSLLAETNEVLNAPEMAKKLKRSPAAVNKKISDLRKNGDLPQVDRSKAFDSKGRPWNREEDKKLMAMKKRGASHKEISEALERPVDSINNRASRLCRKGKIKPRQTNWTNEEKQKLIDNLSFDENGFVNNYSELSRITRKRYEQVQNKVAGLRRKGLILSPKQGTTSVKAKESMTRFNDARFAHVPKKKEEVLMNGPAVNQPDVSIESKQVSLILTTVIVSGQRTDQYFTQEGELIATKKEPTSAATEISK